MVAKDNTKITDFFNQNSAKTPNAKLENIKEEASIWEMSVLDNLEYSLNPMKENEDSFISDSLLNEFEEEKNVNIEESSVEYLDEDESLNLSVYTTYKFKINSPSSKDVRALILKRRNENKISKDIHYSNEKDMIVHYQNTIIKEKKEKYNK